MTNRVAPRPQTGYSTDSRPQTGYSADIRHQETTFGTKHGYKQSVSFPSLFGIVKSSCFFWRIEGVFLQVGQGISMVVRELIPKNVIPLPQCSFRSPETPPKFVAVYEVEKCHFRATPIWTVGKFLVFLRKGV